MHPGITGKHKMDSRWSSGIWLGMRERTNESIIGTNQGCLKVRSIKRKPDGLRWKGTQWDNLQGVPWEPVPGREGIHLKSKVTIPRILTDSIPEPAVNRKQPRRVYINKKEVLQ